MKAASIVIREKAKPQKSLPAFWLDPFVVVIRSESEESLYYWRRSVLATLSMATCARYDQRRRHEGESSTPSRLLPQGEHAENRLLLGDQRLCALSCQRDHLGKLVLVEHLVLGRGLYLD